MKSILFYGETSRGAVHGVSISNDLFIEGISDKFSVDCLEEKSDLAEHNQVSRGKLIGFLYVLMRILFKVRGCEYTYFYSVISLSNMGAIKSLLVLYSIKLRYWRINVVTHVHRGDLDKKVNGSLFFRFLVKRVFSASDNVLLISEKQTKRFNAINYLGCSNYRYICNSIELSDGSCSSVVGLSQAKTSYIYLSNYIIEKGILDLLSVWRAMEQGMTLKCYGGDSSELNLNGLISEYGSDVIQFNSAVSGTAKTNALLSAKALILPSLNEGAPLVILEAMSLGVPVIASKVGFIAEMLGEDYPFFFEAANLESMKASVLKFEALSDDRKLELGESLKEKFNLNFSREKRISDYLKVFI